MSVNTDPIYSRAGDVQIAGPIITAASVVHDGSGTIGTDVYLLWTPNAANGGFLQKVIFKYVANATTTSVAAMLKLYLSTVSSGAVTNANMALIDEIALPATGVLSTTSPQPTYVWTAGFALQGTNRFLCAKITVAQSASTGWMSTAIGGSY